MPTYMPHGACWLWNAVLIVLHAVGDLGTSLYYAVIPAIALYVYHRGHLANLKAAYPRLWRRGAGFIAFCGLSHLGAFAEIWMGGWLYYLTGGIKLCMLAASALFAWEFWRLRWELIAIGRGLDMLARDHALKEAP